jgi:hypothetical protein
MHLTPVLRQSEGNFEPFRRVLLDIFVFDAPIESKLKFQTPVRIQHRFNFEGVRTHTIEEPQNTIYQVVPLRDEPQRHTSQGKPISVVLNDRIDSRPSGITLEVQKDHRDAINSI